MLATVVFGAALSLTVTPGVSLVDAPVSIRVTGASPYTHVSIEGKAAIFGTPFESHAVFVANARGEVDAGAQAPITGTYGGINGMGLFWSMLPAGQSHSDRPGSFDYLAPRAFTFSARSKAQRSECTAIRRVLAAGVRYVDVRLPTLFGRFYFHDGASRLPTVIVLGGAEGGVPEDRPAIIASHGFNALALAYFGADGLPQSLSNIPIEDVENAIAWLSAQPTVDASRLAIVGGSKGAEFALLAASHFPQIRSVVAFSPSSVVYQGLFYAKTSAAPPSSWSFGGVPLPYVNGQPDASVEARIAAEIAQKRPVSYAPEYLAQVRKATNRDDATIPVERIQGPILLVSGDDDQLWPSSFMAAEIVRRRSAKKRRFADRWLRYPDAGHEIGEPYFFFSDSVLAHLPRYSMALGGTPAANQAASADAWPKVITFLEDSL